MAAGAGLVVRARGELRFLPALLVESVVSMPRVSRIPGSNVKLALVAGRVLPVIELGPTGASLVVCLVDGEVVALSGLSVERSGFFPRQGEGVELDGVPVPPLDLEAEVGEAMGDRA